MIITRHLGGGVHVRRITELPQQGKKTILRCLVEEWYFSRLLVQLVDEWPLFVIRGFGVDL